jgi:flagellar protein FliS
LLIALYDTLAGDLRRAAQAERRNDIESRCRELNHALLVIGHLEDWISRGPGGELAHQLSAFYSSLRRKMIEAQARRSPEILEEQMAQVLSTREIWQGVQLRESASTIQDRVRTATPNYPGAIPVRFEQRSSSWSA